MSPIIVSAFGAFTALLLVFAISEILAKVTKGWVPSVLVIMILMLVGFSTGLFPKTIIDDAGVSDALFKVACGLLVTHLGTLISRKEMAVQWKTVIISLMGVASIAVICLTLGTALFGFDNAIAAAPPLAGGAIATAMMSSAANEAGKTSAALVAIVCLSLQGLVGYPLTSFCLKKETKRLTKLYRNGEFKATTAASEDKKDEKKKRATSTTIILLKLALITLAAYWIDYATKGYIPMYVVCLLLGFAAHELKLVETDALHEASSYGFIMTTLMMGLFKTLASSGTDGIASVVGISAALVVFATVAMGLMALLASKIFKQSFFMCYAVVLNAFSGFPINMLITTEAININTEEGDERDNITAEIMPKMLVAGFVCVTIVSVLLAGILVRFL
ncbi:MAG: hypothetical protein UF217_00460 [Acutalibacteraceae bacterium]|nr:hypothetical protein [Acutalibacteraceae bacterium]